MGLVSLLYTQSGEGTQSPNNIRTILAPIEINGIGKIYDGYLDTVKGEIIIED